MSRRSRRAAVTRDNHIGDPLVPVTIGKPPEHNFANPIGLLTDCHRRIEHFLSVLTRVGSETLGISLTEEQRTALETALRYFRDAAPKHTADEEESLFPRLRAASDPEMTAILDSVASLEADHGVAARGHAELDRLGTTWLADGVLTGPERARFSEIATELQRLYASHIELEENRVFPAAAAVISERDRQGIGAEMAARRGLR